MGGDLDQTSRLRVGDLFAGKYRIERLLAIGGMGAVYVVQHAETLGRHALKVMRPEIVENPDLRRRFVQEARVATAIDSVHVVRVTDAGVDATTGLPYLVMELLDGRDLSDELAARGRVSLLPVVAWLGQTAKALDKAHARGIVHRDLKPENLFLVRSDEEGERIKILDFGVAKFLQETPPLASVAAGTPLYMAPEQASAGQPIGPATDVWALGLIAYTLLVGQPYWRARGMFELFGEIIGQERESPTVRAQRTANVALPDGFDAWFARCIAIDPAARFGTASEAIAGLARLGPAERPSRRKRSIVPTGVDRRIPVERPRNRRRGQRSLLIGITAGTLVAGVGAIAVIHFVRSRHDAHADPGLSRRMVRIAGAAFMMGSDDGASDERPPHRESIETFLMDVTEVTVASYRTCTTANKCTPPGTGGDCNWAVPGRDDHPVNCVTVAQAAAYCQWQGKRLPSEAEWEYAACGTDGRSYPWGDDAPSDRVCWSGENVAAGKPGPTSTCVVGSHPRDRSPFGVLDLGGNVWEWTSTPYCGYATPGCNATERVDRGGGWGYEDDAGIRCRERFHKDPSFRGGALGFRCVRGP